MVTGTIDGQYRSNFNSFIRTTGHAAVDYQFRLIPIYEFRCHKRGIDFADAAFGQQFSPPFTEMPSQSSVVCSFIRFSSNAFSLSIAATISILIFFYNLIYTAKLLLFTDMTKLE